MLLEPEIEKGPYCAELAVHGLLELPRAIFCSVSTFSSLIYSGPLARLRSC